MGKEKEAVHPRPVPWDVGKGPQPILKELSTVLQPARGPTHTAFLSPDGHALDAHSWGWSNALRAPPGPGTPTAALLPKTSASPRPQPGIRGHASVKRQDAGPPCCPSCPWRPAVRSRGLTHHTGDCHSPADGKRDLINEFDDGNSGFLER